MNTLKNLTTKKITNEYTIGESTETNRHAMPETSSKYCKYKVTLERTQIVSALLQ